MARAVLVALLIAALVVGCAFLRGSPIHRHNEPHRPGRRTTIIIIIGPGTPTVITLTTTTAATTTAVPVTTTTGASTSTTAAVPGTTSTAAPVTTTTGASSSTTAAVPGTTSTAAPVTTTTGASSSTTAAVPGTTSTAAPVTTTTGASSSTTAAVPGTTSTAAPVTTTTGSPVTTTTGASSSTTAAVPGTTTTGAAGTTTTGAASSTTAGAPGTTNTETLAVPSATNATMRVGIEHSSNGEWHSQWIDCFTNAPIDYAMTTTAGTLLVIIATAVVLILSLVCAVFARVTLRQPSGAETALCEVFRCLLIAAHYVALFFATGNSETTFHVCYPTSNATTVPPSAACANLEIPVHSVSIAACVLGAFGVLIAYVVSVVVRLPTDAFTDATWALQLWRYTVLVSSDAMPMLFAPAFVVLNTRSWSGSACVTSPLALIADDVSATAIAVMLACVATFVFDCAMWFSCEWNPFMSIVAMFLGWVGALIFAVTQIVVTHLDGAGLVFLATYVTVIACVLNDVFFSVGFGAFPWTPSEAPRVHDQAAGALGAPAHPRSDRFEFP